jgi:hypothetical protein
MAYTAEEFLKLDPSTFAGPPIICAQCKMPITGSDKSDMRDTADGKVHEDCYFSALGELIEEHPICTPGRPRHT